MSDFKVGDSVWWIDLYRDYRGNYVCRGDLDCENGQITKLVNIDTAEIDSFKVIPFDCLYKSKQECIDAFKKRLDEL